MPTERALARYLRRDVYAHSAYYRPLLERASFDLSRLPPTSLDEVEDPRALVLRPDATTITRHGEPGLALRYQWARLLGRTDAFGRAVIDPVYKPVLWVMDGGVPVGSSAADTERLGEFGRQWLEGAGVVPEDVVISVVPPGPSLAFWQLVLGARRAGLSSLFLEAPADPTEVAALRPTVLAGAVDELVALLEAPESLPGLRTVLVVGAPLDPASGEKLQTLAGEQCEVLTAWAPAGVRSLWWQCRGGVALHSEGDAGVLEAVGGELVWSALDWHGTVLLRLRTGVFGAVEHGRCPSCGRPGPRVRPESVPERDGPAFTRLLDGHPGVEGWQAELRTVDGSDELIVFLAPSAPGHPGDVLRDLVRSIDVTQFVILDPAALEARVRDHGGDRVIDTRT